MNNELEFIEIRRNFYRKPPRDAKGDAFRASLPIKRGRLTANALRAMEMYVCRRAIYGISSSDIPEKSKKD
jgi:hypothetical protein